jgi:chromosomal replication initiator protein
MQAIGNALARTSPDVRLAYLSAERFMNEMISAIRFKRTPEFRNRYRSSDVLLIDDIHFLEGKEGTQEEFFHTFNALYEAQKQIVLTSDCAPREIATLEERLRSRFEWGLIADLQAPDIETKVAILRKKAETFACTLDDEVALYIASRVKSNVRELEGCLTKVCACASLSGRPVDVGLVQESLKDLFAAQQRAITVEAIQQAVAERFRLRPADLKTRSNSKAIAEPRQIAMYLCKTLLGTSYPELGRIFGGKHHSTVIHSVRKVSRLMETDEAFHNLVNTIRDSLG